MDHRACGCRKHEEGPCENFKYGFRRIYTPQAIVEEIDFEPHFEEQKKYSEILRKELIQDHVFGTAKKDLEEEINSDSARNTASFAFVFYDENTKQIGGSYYFKPNANRDNVEKPFFFLSGRSYRAYQDTDSYEWESLSEAAIKEEDGRLLDAFIPEKRIDRLRQMQMHDREYIDMLERNQANFRDELRVFLWNTCDKEPFFDYLKNREARVIDSSLFCCKTFSDINIPKVEKLSKLNNKQWHYRPKQNTKNFTHSEQFALYRMGVNNMNNFTTFIKACKECLGADWDTLHKVAILIYTRNTMCVRCSHSIITDFCLPPEPEQSHAEVSRLSQAQTLTKSFLSCSAFPRRISAVFLASASFPYQSHTDETDGFERFLKGESFQPYDETYNPGKSDVPTFADFPKGIYHHHLISLQLRSTCEMLRLPSMQGNSASQIDGENTSDPHSDAVLCGQDK